MTLNKQGKNISFEIRDYELNKKGEKQVNYTDEAYLKQRRNLNPDVFKEMNRLYLKDFYEKPKYIRKKKGYILCAIDGSKIEIPNTQKNREVFGSEGNQYKRNTARALISGIYDVENHFFVNVQINRTDSNEINLAKENIVEGNKIIGKNKEILIFDRNYPSIEFFNWLEENEKKFVMRLSSNDYIKERENMKSKDEEKNIEYTCARLNKIKKSNNLLYEKIKDKLPELSEERKQITEAVVKIQVEWMEAFAKEFPNLAGNARSIHTSEDRVFNTSYETYLRGELGTYSEELLGMYGRFIAKLVGEGKNLARLTMENTARLYGYDSLESAEKSL